jgi:uncharacterized RDD family membrane protein YckC
MKFRNRSDRHLGNDLTLATIKRRFAAFLLDWLIIALIYVFILLILSLFKMNITSVETKSIFDVQISGHDVPALWENLLKLLFGVIPVAYFTLIFYFTNGRTPGKALLKVKVVALYHERLGFWHCFERTMGYFASVAESGFGFIQALWNPNRMALHDKIAETVVVNISG